MSNQSSKDYAPNLDMAESLISGRDVAAAQVVLLRAGFLDVARLLKDIRTTSMNVQKLIQQQNRLLEKMNIAMDRTSQPMEDTSEGRQLPRQ